MLDALKKDRLYKHIVSQITRAILRREIAPGDRLPTEPEMVEDYGVSRTVVREAIRALNIQGLVEVIPGKGTFVTQPPVEMVTDNLHLLLTLEDSSFEELLAARRILEVPIARLAAEYISDAQLVRLKQHLNDMENELDDSAEFIRFDTLFHEELAKATGNIVLIVMIQPIISMMHGSREAALRVPDMGQRALHFHKRIYEAMTNRDPDAAAVAMEEHLNQVTEDIQRARGSNT